MRGLIPARAGNTSMRFSFFGVTGAHPRSRGEHIDLPPRPVHGAGLIPARAGNTDRDREGTEYHRAHPRSRGEHQSWVSPFTGAAGSSPLARGTLDISAAWVVDIGLIPARAGNTVSGV